MKKLIFTLLCIFITIGMSACGKSSSSDIVASCYPIYDLTNRIVGDKMSVSCFVPNGVEPHEFDPTPSKVRALADSKLYIENGLGLEKYSLPKEVTSHKLTASDGIEVIYGSDNKTADPHVWLNPLNAIKMMENIKNKVSLLDPDNEVFYQSNYDSQKTLFENLNQKYIDSLVDLKSNYLVTTHEAFGYLCKQYNLNQLSIMGISTEDKPTSQALANIQDKIKGLNVTTIFSEELASDTFATTMSETLNIKCNVLNTIEGLTDETINENYISLMESNLTQILEALK